MLRVYYQMLKRFVLMLSAEAFVGAMFGENILSLFRMEKQTILVTEIYD